MSAPRYAIQFYDYQHITNGDDRTSFKVVVLLFDIAKRLKVEAEQILEAFKKWGEAGYPQEYFLVTGTGEKVRGGSYDIGIHVWNYQGQNSGVMEGPNIMGVVSKVREWGNGYKTVEGTHRESFYLGPLA